MKGNASQNDLYSYFFRVFLTATAFFISIWGILPTEALGALIYSNLNDYNYAPTIGTFGLPLGWTGGQNYQEVAGFRVQENWDLKQVRSVGFALCSNGTQNVPFSIVHYSNAGQILATSTNEVRSFDMPRCNTYATSTPSQMELTYFNFESNRDINEFDSILLKPREYDISSTPYDILLFATNTPITVPVQSSNCYMTEDRNLNCYSPFGAIPLIKIQNNIIYQSETGITTPINKNIEILNPTYGTTTQTNNYTVTIHYKTPFSLDFRPTTTRSFEITNALTNELEYTYSATVPANSGEDLTISVTASTTNGSKYIRAFYKDLNGNVYSEIDEVFFNVATNTYFEATGLNTPLENSNDLTQIDCGTFEFGCQIQKAITFLFKPDTNTLDKFTNLWQTIAEKKPFGYVSVTINQLENLDTTGAQAFNLGTIPFTNEIFTPFKIALSGILWAIFAIYFLLFRLRDLDI